MDGVELSASDPCLLQGVRTSMRPKAEKKGNPKSFILGRIKERAMKDTTNILEVHPVMLKPSWTGLKSGKGGAMREIGHIKTWVVQWEQNDLSGVKKVGPNGPSVSVGPAHAHPPNTSKGVTNLKSLDLTQSDRATEAAHGGLDEGDGPRCGRERSG